MPESPTALMQQLRDEYAAALWGFCLDQLREVLAQLNYRNLDDEEAFAGTNTTTEALARWVADRLADRLTSPGVSDLLVTLHESHVAWASYERPL